MSQASAERFRCNLRPLCARRQGEVATKAGITREYLSKIIHGHATPSLDIAIRLAEAVGSSLEILTTADQSIPQVVVSDATSVHSANV